MPNNKLVLERIAHGLGDMLNQFVFVGGTVVELYGSSHTYQEARQTDDVDCVIEVTSLANYYDLEEKLRQLGFKDDIIEDGPICRKLYKGIKVDVMPTDESILKFSNSWYKEGFSNAKYYILSSSTSIKILPVSYFIASKLEAFFSPSRAHNNDVYASHDFEDIIYILDNCDDVVEQIQTSNDSVKSYIQIKFDFLLKNKPLIYALSGILRDDDSEVKVLKIIEDISRLK
jgi:predicted nucleotidyltransferase